MKYLLFFLITVITSKSFSTEWKVAKTNDKDGYIDIRNGKGNNFERLGIIKKDELFFCVPSNSEWWFVRSLRENINGYVHKSRIQLIELLPANEQRILLENIFLNQANLADKFNQSFNKYDDEKKEWKSVSDSLAYISAREKAETHSSNMYNLALLVLPTYYCSTSDTIIIQILFNTLWADCNSANESPAWAIGSCFLCFPDLTARQIIGLNKNQKKFVKSMIIFGLANVCKTPKQESMMTKILKKY